MNQKPLESLNHFTVPLAISTSFFINDPDTTRPEAGKDQEGN
jgi:hypothetical protein